MKLYDSRGKRGRMGEENRRKGEKERKKVER